MVGKGAEGMLLERQSPGATLWRTLVVGRPCMLGSIKMVYGYPKATPFRGRVDARETLQAKKTRIRPREHENSTEG